MLLAFVLPNIFMRLLIIRLISFLRIYFINSAYVYFLLNFKSLTDSWLLFTKITFFSINLVKEEWSFVASRCAAYYASILIYFLSSSCFFSSYMKFISDCSFLIYYLMMAISGSWLIKSFKHNSLYFKLSSCPLISLTSLKTSSTLSVRDRLCFLQVTLLSITCSLWTSGSRCDSLILGSFI